MTTKLRLGKRPARKGAVKFRLASYLDLSKLPVPPAEFGHRGLITDWKMLGNDVAGNCLWAGSMHQIMQWNKEAGRDVIFDDSVAFKDYSALTGYDPAQTDSDGNNPTDQGTDMQQAAEYFRTTGIIDANGQRHTILAYLGIEAGNIDEHYLAAYLFKAVGLGIRFPRSAMDQTNSGQPWTVVEDSPIDGGHFTPALYKNSNGDLTVITWGAEQIVTVPFIKRYNDESLVYLTEEDLINGKNLEGFALQDLQSDLAALRQ